MNNLEHKQPSNTNDLQARARFLKHKHKVRRDAELKRRGMAHESNSPRMIAKLICVNKWKKMVLVTEDEPTIAMLCKIDDTYKHLQDCKRPTYAVDDKPGVYFKVSVPQFMHDDLFSIDALAGRTISVVFHAKSYENTKMGTGYYLTLAAMPRLLTSEEG